MNLNSSLNSPFPIEQINDVDHDQHHQALNFGHHQLVSSSSSSTSASICHIFFNSTQDHTGLYHRQFYQPHHQEGDNYANYHGVGGSCYEIKNKAESGLESTLWKKEDQSVLEKENQVNWRWSSKMKMKNTSDRIAPTVNMATAKIEVEKAQQSASSFETDMSSSHNSNTPIRVCSDCHTTKTPLWRSGPKGPKSLCNACGIRQRKARRAMAVAASGTAVISDQLPAMKIKVQYKEKMGKNGHSSQFKKRCSKMTDANATVAGSSLGSSGKKKKKRKKKLGFEDFLINLSNKLAFHRVFPQDEKDAAMLLMALSSGLVHG